MAAKTAVETGEKPMPEAAKLEGWASSWPVEDEHEHEPGKPPSEAAISKAKLVTVLKADLKFARLLAHV